MLGEDLLVHNQRGPLGFERRAATDQPGECFAGGMQGAEGVQDGQLSWGVEQRLVIVGAVDIDQTFAERAQRLQCRR